MELSKKTTNFTTRTAHNDLCVTAIKIQYLMRKIVSLIAIINILTFSLFGQEICICDLDKTDTLIYQNGKIFHGDFKCIFEKENLIEKGFIDQGRLDSSVFYKNDILTEIIWYKDNEINRRRLYRNAITTYLIINLKDGVEHGLWERYYLNGKLKEQKMYKMGKPVGKWTSWDKKGRVIYKCDFTTDPIIDSFHSYTRKKHKSLIRYTDKKTNKILKTEKKTEELMKK